MASSVAARAAGGRRLPAGDGARSTASTTGEVGYVATGLKNVKDCRVGDTITDGASAAPSRCPATGPPSRWSSPASIPSQANDYAPPARRPRQAQAQRRRAHLRAGVQRRPRLRLPLRLPRPAAHGDRAGAAGARVRPRPARHRAQRRVRGDEDRRHGARRRQPGRPAAADGDRRHPRAVDEHQRSSRPTATSAPSWSW